MINSRQLPMQFLEAYKAVVNLEKLLSECEKGHTANSSGSKPVAQWKKDKMQKVQEKYVMCLVSV